MLNIAPNRKERKEKPKPEQEFWPAGCKSAFTLFTLRRAGANGEKLWAEGNFIPAFERSRRLICRKTLQGKW